MILYEAVEYAILHERKQKKGVNDQIVLEVRRKKTLGREMKKKWYC